ncbi:hypothetical protein ACFL6M_07260, partial [Candidatus Eisenbacteria bacterium]
MHSPRIQRILRFFHLIPPHYIITLLATHLLLIPPATAGILNISQSPRNSRHPDMVIGPDSTLHIVWEEELATTKQIIYRSMKNAEWTDPRALSDPAYTAGLPSIAIDCTSGIMFIAWHEKRDDVY